MTSQIQGDVKGARKIKGNPSVVPAMNFDAKADAEALHKAMNDNPIDNDTLIDIICRRSNDQRQEIIYTYKTIYDEKSLVREIGKQTSENLREVLLALMMSPSVYYATELYRAVDRSSTNELFLVEVLGTVSQEELRSISSVYQERFRRTLQSDLKSGTSGNFANLLMALAYGYRDASEVGQSFHGRLAVAGETTESKLLINMLFGLLSHDELIWVYEEYPKVFGKTLDQAIEDAFTTPVIDLSFLKGIKIPFANDFFQEGYDRSVSLVDDYLSNKKERQASDDAKMKDGLSIILNILANTKDYFASSLRQSMAVDGTRDLQLIRLIVTRTEKDMQDIKVAFARLTGESLKQWIKEDTAGQPYYQKALLTLIGE